MNLLGNMRGSQRLQSLENARTQFRKNLGGNTYSVKRGCCVLLGNLIPDQTGKYSFHSNGAVKLSLAENTLINQKLDEINEGD